MDGAGSMSRPAQLPLELAPRQPAAGSLNLDARLRDWLRRAVDDSGLSRAEVAQRMTLFVHGVDAEGGEITKASLDKWLQPSGAEWRFPLAYLPAFVHATAGAPAVIEPLMKAAGYAAMPSADVALAQLAALKVQQRALARREAQLAKLVNAESLRAIESEGGER